jgi:homoserine kinase
MSVDMPYCGALASGQSLSGGRLDDKLLQPYRAALNRHDEVFAAGKAAGALGVAMSGAGPSLMAYTTEKIDAIGEAMVQAFKKYDISSRYLCLGIDYQGARIVDFA